MREFDSPMFPWRGMTGTALGCVIGVSLAVGFASWRPDIGEIWGAVCGGVCGGVGPLIGLSVGSWLDLRAMDRRYARLMALCAANWRHTP